AVLGSGYRKDVSSPVDAAWLMAVGLGNLFLSALLVSDAETIILMLFLIGFGYLFGIGYLVLLCYLLVRMLVRRDAWLRYFLAMSAFYVVYLLWVPQGFIGFSDLAIVFMGVAIPYALASIALSFAMKKGSLNARAGEDELK
ncbi:hypothetical protein, partial [Azoarcus taiwanensis]